MNTEIKGAAGKAREYWQKQPRRKKLIFGFVCGGILAVAVLGTVLLNAPKIGYKVLFPGMSTEESAQVYATLQELDVQPEIDGKGQVLVPANDWDSLVFQLNGKGYPKSTLSYDTFSNASGFTSTEFEKKAALIFQAQDRMQQTLMRQEGVEEATVTFTVPESSNYIWDRNNQQESTGGVSVLMKPGYELTPERVTAIKHLASTSVPKLKPDKVVVVDAATGIEVPGTDDAAVSGFYSVQRLDFERQIAKQIEDNIKRLLAGKYGADGVTAVATVTLDYDKMMSETKQYQPMENGDGGGVRNKYEEHYTLNGQVPAEGIVGEENNTDVPQYPNQDGTGSAGATDYDKSISYDVSYIMTQIEKGAPLLKKSSVAVIVNDPQFDTQVEETLVDLISKGVNISADNIKVTNLDFVAQPVIKQEEETTGLTMRQLLLIGLGGLLLVLLIVVILVIVIRKTSRKRRADAETAEEEALAEEERLRQRSLEREIEEHKRMLQDEAMSASNSKENAITEEVREFAKDNPEITAALIRTMLREEK